MAIPISPSEFDTAWLEKALDAPAGSIVDFSYQQIGTGQMCDSFRLSLAWKNHDGPATVIAKCPSHDEQSRNIAALIGNYILEVGWYQHLAEKSAVDCPRCFHAEIAENGIDFALLLADCVPAKQGNQLEGAGNDALRPAIVQLTALHRPFWNQDLAAQHAWLNRDNSALIKNMLPSLAEGFAQRYAGRLANEILDLGRQLAANIDAYLGWKAAANTLVHGDFRVDNLLFAPDGSVTVVDWQTVAMGSPFADLAYLIGTSFADPSARAEAERSLFDLYCANINGTQLNLDFDAAWRDYRIYALSGVLMAIFASMNVERTERGDEMFALMAERPAQQALDLDSLSLIC